MNTERATYKVTLFFQRKFIVSIRLDRSLYRRFRLNFQNFKNTLI